MKVRQVLMLAALGLMVTVLSGLVGAQVGNAPAKARPTATAVLDIQKTLEALTERTVIEADLAQKNAQLKAKEDDLKKRLQGLQDDMGILAVGSQAYMEKQSELEQKAMELQAMAAFHQQRMARERTLQTEGIYRKISDAAGRVAKEGGFDVVMVKEPAPDYRGAKPEQVQMLLQMRKVIWSAPDLDITNDVIQKMNNEYKNKPPTTLPK